MNAKMLQPSLVLVFAGSMIALFTLVFVGTEGGVRGEERGAGESVSQGTQGAMPMGEGVGGWVGGEVSQPSSWEDMKAVSEADLMAGETETVWEGQIFPQHTQVPAELGEVHILACDEVLLDNGRSIRLILLEAAATGEGTPLLLIEGGDGYGGVMKRGIFDPSIVRVHHRSEDNRMVFQKLSDIGLGELAMSSTDDGRISVMTPENPHAICTTGANTPSALLVLELLSAIQSQLGDSGMAQLTPLRSGWGDLSPAYGDRTVEVR